MAVRAKFKVEAVTHNVSGASITLFPVTGESTENKEFYKYTPGGKIELATVNKAAAEQFIPGKEFYVDFTAADLAK